MWTSGCPAISHLLFADDSLFFLKADRQNSLNLAKQFKDYERVLDQTINFDKSAIAFGNNVFQHIRDDIQGILNIPNISGGGKYLGLPEQFTRKKSDSFKYVKENVLRKIQGWHNRFLSNAGKETLIKSAVSAMPVFSMNCYKLPTELCTEIDVMISKFWWGSNGNSRKI